jgi:hypothetical protein
MNGINYENPIYTPSFITLFVFLILDTIYSLCLSYGPMTEGSQAIIKVGYLSTTGFFHLLVHSSTKICN